MIIAEGLIGAFTRNANYVHTHFEGLTHTDAVLQPPVTGNCMLWIIGHIVCYLNYILAVLYCPPIFPEVEAQRFARGSAPVLADEPSLPRLEALLKAYHDSQPLVFEGILTLTSEQAAEVITQRNFTMSRAELVMSYMRHESYHAGQLELRREIALSKR